MAADFTTLGRQRLAAQAAGTLLLIDRVDVIRQGIAAPLSYSGDLAIAVKIVGARVQYTVLLTGPTTYTALEVRLISAGDEVFVWNNDDNSPIFSKLSSNRVPLSIIWEYTEDGTPAILNVTIEPIIPATLQDVIDEMTGVYPDAEVVAKAIEALAPSPDIASEDDAKAGVGNDLMTAALVRLALTALSKDRTVFDFAVRQDMKSFPDETFKLVTPRRLYDYWEERVTISTTPPAPDTPGTYKDFWLVLRQ